MQKYKRAAVSIGHIVSHFKDLSLFGLLAGFWPIENLLE